MCALLVPIDVEWPRNRGCFFRSRNRTLVDFVPAFVARVVDAGPGRHVATRHVEDSDSCEFPSLMSSESDLGHGE